MKTTSLISGFILAVALASQEIVVLGRSINPDERSAASIHDTHTQLPPSDLDFHGSGSGINVECSTTVSSDTDTTPVSYALCYYAICEFISDDGEISTEAIWPWTAEGNAKGVGKCGCVAWHGLNTVGVDSILNETLKYQTLDICPEGDKSPACNETNSAPICEYINHPKRMYDITTLPEALGLPDLISDFSMAFTSNQTGEEGDGYGWEMGATNCQKGLYASCMTAPCYDEPITIDGVTYPVTCYCPVVEHEFTVGQDNVECEPGKGLVWSASYSVLTMELDAEDSD